MEGIVGGRVEARNMKPFIRAPILVCLVVSLLVPGLSAAQDPVTVSKTYMLYHDEPGGFGCSPDQESYQRTMCIRVPAGARTFDIRIEPQIPTGTPADEPFRHVGVRYGTDYAPGPRGQFCGTATGIDLELQLTNRILILAFAGPNFGPRICNFPTEPWPGIGTAGTVFATFHFA